MDFLPVFSEYPSFYPQSSPSFRLEAELLLEKLFLSEPSERTFERIYAPLSFLILLGNIQEESGTLLSIYLEKEVQEELRYLNENFSLESVEKKVNELIQKMKDQSIRITALSSVHQLEHLLCIEDLHPLSHEQFSVLIAPFLYLLKTASEQAPLERMGLRTMQQEIDHLCSMLLKKESTIAKEQLEKLGQILSQSHPSVEKPSEESVNPPL